MKDFNFSQDKKGNVLPIPSVPTTVDCRVLAANTAESHTIPEGSRFMQITASGGLDIWVNFTATATIPATDITDGSCSILNPDMFSVGSSTSVSLICGSVCTVVLSFWS